MMNDNRGCCGHSYAGNSQYGKYFTVLLGLLSGWVCVVSLGQGFASPTNLLLTLSAGWVICRALGFVNYPFISLVLSSMLMVLVVSITSVSVVGQTLAAALVALLLAVIWMDATEFYYQYLLQPAGRQRLRKFVYRHGRRIVWFGVIGFIFANGVLLPVIAEWAFQQQPPADDMRQAMERLSLAENITFKLCESLAAVFAFVVGTCVGSFLNVVVYRVPRRISVLVKPSHCPGCSDKILARDNIPGIGWLKLQGKCRNCSTSISSRYPTVELIVGLLFLLLYFVELISGGANLPGRSPNLFAGVQWILFYTKWDLVGLTTYHALLICTLFSWGMIRRDKQKLPVTTAAFMLIVFGGLPLLWPGLTPLPGLPGGYSLTEASITLGLGLVAAAIAVSVTRLLQQAFSIAITPIDIPSWLLIGVSLGWQAVAGIFVCCLILRMLVALHASLHRLPTATSLKVAAQTTGSQYLLLSMAVIVHHCFWRTVSAAL
jgi:leader peptidase (prepilin peptidase)/N-methyltransferase